jgi:hypothetical protein
MTPQDENRPVDPGDMPEEVVEPMTPWDDAPAEATADAGETAGETADDDWGNTGVPPVLESSDNEMPSDPAPVHMGESPALRPGVNTATPPRRRVLSGGWTMALLLSGIGLIAACVLIPQGDETRRLMYEREKLRMDLEQVRKQVATNEDFLKKVQDDPTLAQRLAQRQMKLIPAGSQVLDIDASPTKDDKSPFLIVTVPPPAPLAPYQAKGGWFSDMCRNGRSQLYMIGGGLMLVAAGLVLGASGPRD